MYKDLTKKEKRMIEQAKRQGEEMQRNADDNQAHKKGAPVKSFIILVIIFFLMAFGAKLIFSFIS